MAIKNFPLPTDVCGILFSYAEDRTLPALGTTVDAQDAANREIVQRLVNQNLEWLTGKRLNAILRDPRFYQLPPTAQNKVWEKLDPSGNQISWAVLGYTPLPASASIPEKYRARLFDQWKAGYKEKNYSIIDFPDTFDLSTDVGRVALEAVCYQNREMVFNIRDPKLEEIQAIADSAQKMDVRSLKVKGGVLSDEGFEILKSSGLEIDAKETTCPVNWLFILATVIITLGVVAFGLGLCVPFFSCNPAGVGSFLIGLPIAVWGGSGVVVVSIDLYKDLERSHSQNRIFIPAAGVN